MAECIILKGGGSSGSDDCTAIASEVLTGKTAIVKGSDDEAVTGTMPNNGNVSKQLSAGETYTIPNGYHGGSGTVKAKDLASQTSGSLDSARMVSGQNGYANGRKVNGSMVDRGAYTWAGRGGHGAAGMGEGVENGTEYYAFNNAPDGWYHNQGDEWSPELRLERSKVRSYLGISTDKIRKGASIAGISGSWYGEKVCISACAYEILNAGEECKYEENSYTMPASGTVYYGGMTGGYNAVVTRCEIWKNGTLIDSRNINKDYAARTTMVNKSLTANAGDVIKVVAAASANAVAMSSIQAVIVY